MTSSVRGEICVRWVKTPDTCTLTVVRLHVEFFFCLSLLYITRGPLQAAAGAAAEAAVNSCSIFMCHLFYSKNMHMPIVFAEEAARWNIEAVKSKTRNFIRSMTTTWTADRVEHWQISSGSEYISRDPNHFKRSLCLPVASRLAQCQLHVFTTPYVLQTVWPRHGQEHVASTVNAHCKACLCHGGFGMWHRSAVSTIQLFSVYTYTLGMNSTMYFNCAYTDAWDYGHIIGSY